MSTAPEGYDPHAFAPFAVTVDLAVFTVREARLHVLLVERGQAPYKGRWALPGGFVLPRESAEEAARRELAEETGLTQKSVCGFHLEQLRTYTDPDRDPRMRVVSVAYAALVPDLPEPRGGGGRGPRPVVGRGRHRAARLRPRPHPGGRPRPDRGQARVLLPGHRLLPRRVHPRRAPAGLRDRLGRRARPAQLQAQGPHHARLRPGRGRTAAPHRRTGKARRPLPGGCRYRPAPTLAAPGRTP